MTPDWDDLRYLLAVADKGSASAAARALAVDKATVARRIASLERAVGVRLLHRRAAGWVPTHAGRRVVAAARAVDGRIAAVVADLSGAGGPRATVRLTAPHFFCASVVAPALAELERVAPWLDLALIASSRLVNLAQREAEVAVRNVRPARGELVARKAGDLGLALYAAKSYLSRRRAPRDRDDVAGHRVVGFLDAIAYGGTFSWLDAIADRLEVAVRVDDAQALHAAVRAGAGLGVMPCLLGDADPLLTRVLDDRHVDTIWLVSPADLAGTRAVRVVMTFVADLFRRHADALAGA